MTIRLVSWNIRAGGGKRKEGILAQLLAWKPDIIGLSEFRGTPASQWIAAQLAENGYPHQLSSTDPEHPPKNALLLASQVPLTAVSHPKMPDNRERWLLAETADQRALTIGLMHVPNYTKPELKYPFLTAVLDLMSGWEGGDAILMGDTNCGKRGIDEERVSPPRFHREHDFIVGVGERGWRDVFRAVHGDRREYTWYSHRDNGFRLDYGFVSPDLGASVADARHIWGGRTTPETRREILSDHAALVVELG